MYMELILQGITATVKKHPRYLVIHIYKVYTEYIVKPFIMLKNDFSYRVFDKTHPCFTSAIP